MECSLLRLKLKKESVEAVSALMLRCSLKYDEASADDITRFGPTLNLCSQTGTVETHFKVPFTRVLDLVAQRKVFLRHGFAFVPVSLVNSLITSTFESELLAGLSKAKAALSMIEGDERFTPLLAHVRSKLTRLLVWQGRTTELPPHVTLNFNSIDTTAKESFPMCMLSIHQKVTGEGSLDYTAWLHYSTFLKDCGATLKDVTEIWCKRFEREGRSLAYINKKMYDIRHLFGVEGRRVALKSYSCRSIVASTNKAHGCPFRTTDVDGLKAQMVRLGVASQHVTSSVADPTGNHCQLSCSRFLNSSHSTDRYTNITSPVGYFVQSREVRETQFLNSVDWDEEMNIS